MSLTLEHRILAINTPLGPNVFAVRSIIVQEQLGRPFHIEAELSCEQHDIDFDQIVGHNITLRCSLQNDETRYFNGFVSGFSQVGEEDGLAHYRATIVPWLWLLTRTSDCRIFQKKTVPQVIEAVFKGHHFDDYELRLTTTYEELENCVQYRESDFDFVSRLMEQAGIYFFFEHTNGSHVLVLADSLSAHTAFSGYESLSFMPGAQGGWKHEAVTEWIIEREMQAVAYVLNDFNFNKPNTSLLSCASVTRQHGAAHFEHYDWTAEFAEHEHGTRLADVRLEELQSRFEVGRGRSNARGLAVGSTFALERHARADQNREYLITAATLHIKAGEVASGRRGGFDPNGGASVSCEFRVIDATQTFRSPRLTPKPIVQGPQTAIVVGPAGEDIYTDALGRVKVQFHWDRYSTADENSSCWIRVSQPLAGKGWGMVVTPRVGQEVIVDFIEGNPDRPIITGRVYNGVVKPPYPLPENKTMFALKSNSTGTGQGFNELRFEDKKGEEQLFIHAEKNHDVRVKNDSFETVGHDRHLIVGNDQVEHVKNDRCETVDRDHKEKIGRDHHMKIVGKEAKEVGGSLSLVVKGDVIESFKANHCQIVAGDHFVKADNLIFEARTSITIKVGESHIVVSSEGIKIQAQGIVLDAKDSLIAKGATGAVLKSGGLAKLQGGQTVVEGSSQVEVKGGAISLG